MKKKEKNPRKEGKVVSLNARVPNYDPSEWKRTNILGKQLAVARKKKHLSLSGLANELSAYGISVMRQTIGKWEMGEGVPNAYHLFALCDVLEIDDCLSYFTDRAGMLNEEGWHKVAEYRDALVASGRYKPQKRTPVNNVIRYIEMDISLWTASAGTGDWLDEDNFEKMRFPAAEVPDGADFGVRVNGDSMEPVYHDQQIVWIQKCERLDPGDVGLFIYDGNGYIKVYSEQETDEDDFGEYEYPCQVQPVLMSYNEDYEPIPISPHLDFRVAGRVIK